MTVPASEALVFAAENAPQFGGLQSVLTVIGALATLGAIVSAIVTVVRARASTKAEAVSAMSLLFERQADINRQELALRDEEITVLKQKLAAAGGDDPEVLRQLAECERSRIVLRNQLRGLEETLSQMRSGRQGRPH